jgi:hypothetical protein
VQVGVGVGEQLLLRRVLQPQPPETASISLTLSSRISYSFDVEFDIQETKLDVFNINLEL